MPKFKAKIICEWDKNGRIEHSIISDDNKGDPETKIRLLTISMPMLLSHQLGALRPSHGLIICSQIIDYFSLNKCMIYPINSALKSATIELEVKESALIKFSPEHSLFANNDSLEEGVRQFLNNYIFYVWEKLAGDIKLVTRVYTCSTINMYCEMINNAVSENKIGPKMDRWNLSFSTYMSTMTHIIGTTFYFKLSNGITQEQMEQKFQDKFQKLIINHSNALRAMELTN